MARVMKPWNRSPRKNTKVSSKSEKSKLVEPVCSEFKIRRLYMYKKRPKHQGYMIMSKINYGYFNTAALKPKK